MHPAFFKNGKTTPGFFLTLKAVFFFFLKSTTSIFVHFRCSRFSLFGAVFSSVPRQRLGAAKVKVAVFSVAAALDELTYRAPQDPAGEPLDAARLLGLGLRPPEPT